MGKQRTNFFKKCIIVFIMFMFIITGIIGGIGVGTILDSGYENNMMIIYLLGLVTANIVCIIILYFLWSVLKTLEEIRDGNNNDKEEE